MIIFIFFKIFSGRWFFRSSKCIYLDTFKMITDSNPNVFGYPSSIIVDTLRNSSF